MPAETTTVPELTKAEARLPRWMALCAVIALVGILASGRCKFAAGFGLGAAVAILNYYWLHQAIAALMNAGKTRPSKWVVAKSLARYPLMFVGVWVFYKTGLLPFSAILAGLFVPVAGVLIEGVIQLRELLLTSGN